MQNVLMWRFNYTRYTRYHMHFSKVKSTIINHVKCFAPRISAGKNLLKKIESVNENASGTSTTFEQMFLGWDEIYLQNEKFKCSSYNYLMKTKTK